jgi:hypothetical protein
MVWVKFAFLQDLVENIESYYDRDENLLTEFRQELCKAGEESIKVNLIFDQLFPTTLYFSEQLDSL